ncbi:MAG: PAS domain S-box protein [Pseudomonadota bacterium]
MSSPQAVRILYVEDDPGAARLLQRRLHRSGYEVDLARDGVQGLAMCEGGGYDLLAVDHDMPCMSGLEVIRALSSRGSIMPTIMITGAGNEAVAVEAMKLGAEDYIIKDPEARYLDLIPSVIDRALNKKLLIKEKKEAQEALRESEERYRAIYDNAAVGIALLGAGGRPVEANAAWLAMLGCSQDELRRLNYPDVIHPDDRASAEEMLQGLFQGKTERCRFEKRFIRKNGSVLTADVSMAGIRDARGEIRYLIVVMNDITGRKLAEDALRESEARFRGYFELPLTGIATIHREGRWLDVNDKLCRMLGYPKEELTRMTWVELTHPDDLAEEINEFAEVVRGDAAGYSRDKRFIRKDGDTVHAGVSVRSVRKADGSTDYLVALIQDVGDRKLAEEALGFERKQLLSIFDSLDAVVNVIDPKTHEIVYLNRYARDLFGWGEDTKKPCHRLFLGLDAPCPRCGTYGAPTGDGTSVGWEYHNPVLKRDFYSTNRFIKWPDGREVKLAFDVDITERKRSEQLLLQSERLKAVAELSAGVSHNFNNMLQVVLGSAQLSLVDLEIGDSAELKSNLDRIIDTSRFASQIVKRLQYFARFEPGMNSKLVMDLSDVVRQSVEMSQIWWKTVPEKKGVKINLTQSLENDCRVAGKENELFDVALNLIKNSAEALPDGGDIDVAVYTTERHVVLQVRDNGIGIAPEDLGRVFDPFFTTKGVRTSGMGLTGCHGIIKSHKGEITVESTQGKGSVFTVRLPSAEEAGGTDRQDETESSDPPLRILVIDDMRSIVNIMKVGLTRLGQEVLTAHSGEQGLDIFLNDEADLVVCDLGMPGMNGWEVGRRMKMACAESGKPKVPFVLLTGWGDMSQEVEKMDEAGVDAVLEKPVDVAQLLRIGRKLLEER